MNKIIRVWPLFTFTALGKLFMKAHSTICLIAAACAFTHAAMTHGAELDSYSVVKLSYGPNHVDINNDGNTDVIFLAWRENFNAHSFNVVSFYLQTPSTEKTMKPWNIVPLVGKNKERLTLDVSGGADCLLNDFRLLKPKKGTQSLLILAERDYSESFYEENTVNFHYYTFEKNSEGEMGAPFVFFGYQKTIKSKLKYCDVNQAFRSELGLENYMERN